MHCHICGQWEVDVDARFCGQCGVALQPPRVEVVASSSALSELLRQLTERVEKQAWLPRSLAWDLRACMAAEAGGLRPTIVVLGLARRGKSTVINRLIGQRVATTSLRQTRCLLQVRHQPSDFDPTRQGRSRSDSACGPTGMDVASAPHDHAVPDSNASIRHDSQQFVSVSPETQGHACRVSSVPSENESHPAFLTKTRPDMVQLVYSAAPLLKSIDLVDTPALEPADDPTSVLSLQQALSSQGIIFCLDARQILSVTEREILQNQLLPFTSCPIALAVTYLDQVPDPVDQAELRDLLLRHIQRLDPDRLELLMLPPGRDAVERVPELEDWIARQALRPSVRHAAALRLLDLLASIEALLPDESTKLRERVIEQHELEQSVLSREHDLAVTQTCALIRESLSHLRGDLKAIMLAASEGTRGQQGLSHVVARLRVVMESCGRQYLSTLQAALRVDGPRGLRATSSSIDKQATLPIRLAEQAAPEMPIASRRDHRASGLEAAAVCAAVLMPSWVAWLGAGVAILAVQQWRETQRQRREAEATLDGIQSLHAWLNAVEPQLLDRFTQATETVFRELQQQVARRFEQPATHSDQDGQGSDLHGLITHCRQLLSQESMPPC